MMMIFNYQFTAFIVVVPQWIGLSIEV